MTLQEARAARHENRRLMKKAGPLSLPIRQRMDVLYGELIEALV